MAMMMPACGVRTDVSVVRLSRYLDLRELWLILVRRKTSGL
jgi:hypothetical protein